MANLSSGEKRARTRRRNAAKRRSMARAEPKGRLRDDGAAHPDAIRKRLLWLAHERGIPVDEVPKVLQVMTVELSDFCKAHRLSLNWVIGGCLNDLQYMLRQQPAEREPTFDEFKALLGKLDAVGRRAVVDKLRSMVTQ